MQQQSTRTSTTAPTQQGPQSTAPGMVQSNADLQAKLLAHKAAVAAALGMETEEEAPALEQEAGGGQAQVAPTPDVDGGPVDEALRVLSPEALLGLSNDELIVYIDECLAWWTGEEDVAEVEAAEAGSQGPTQVQLDEAAAILAGEDEEEDVDVYLNQLDNDQAGNKAADAQCSATSATMALLKLADGDEAAFMAETRTLIGDNGGTASKDCPEELFIELLLTINWEEAYTAAPAMFANQPTWQSGHPGDDVIKHPYAQAYAASLYAFCAQDSLECSSKFRNAEGTEDRSPSEGASFEDRWAHAITAKGEGAELTFQGDFTGSGHVVYVVGINDSQVVVHDPYGLKRPSGRYIKNGCKPPKSDDTQAEIETRSGGHGPTMVAYEAQEPYERWGEHNVYTKDEIKSLGALSWLLILRKA